MLTPSILIIPLFYQKSWAPSPFPSSMIFQKSHTINKGVMLCLFCIFVWSMFYECLSKVQQVSWISFGLIKTFPPSIAFHIETSNLIWTANQTIGFCIEWNTWLKLVNIKVFRDFLSGLILHIGEKIKEST